MGLILCRNYPAQHPYYFEILGVRIYSIEELCYVIYEYPYLVLDGFVDEKLIDFLINELEMSSLVKQIERSTFDSVKDETYLMAILEYSGIYNAVEINKYRLKINSILKLSRAAFLKEKADVIFSLKKYGKAIRYYKAAIKSSENNDFSEEFLGQIYNNLGSAYANQFFFEDAMESYFEAYKHLKDKRIVKQAAFLSFMDESIDVSEYFGDIITESFLVAVKKEYQTTLNSYSDIPALYSINSASDSSQNSKERFYSKIISKLKLDYRKMI